MDKELSSQITKKLNQLDHNRDVLVLAFLKWLQALTDFPVEALAKDAATLLHYVEGFGKNIAVETFLAETTILNNIVDGFTNDDARKAALAGLHGTEWISAIKTSNDAFATEYNNRVVIAAGNGKVESFTTVRKASTNAYIDMISLLMSRYETDAEDKKDVSVYESCIAELNVLIAKVNILAETSVARKATDAKDTVKAAENK